MAGYWETIQSSYLQALSEGNIDNWIIKEIQHNEQAVTKFRSFDDIQSWILFLEEQVRNETNPGGSGVQFFSFTGD